jgi:hypothetical protein
VELNIVNEVATLERLSVGQLRQRFAELFGEMARPSRPLTTRDTPRGLANERDEPCTSMRRYPVQLIPRRLSGTVWTWSI